MKPLVRRRAFTLIEVLVVLTIILILAATALFVMFRAESAARQAKTRVRIAGLHRLVFNAWEGYASRRLPIRRYSNDEDLDVYLARKEEAIDALRRMDFPQTWDDIVNTDYIPDDADGLPMFGRTALSLAYKAMYDEITAQAAFSAEVRTIAEANGWDLSAVVADPGAFALPDGRTMADADFRTKAAGTPPSTQFEQAECLYLIVRFACDGPAAFRDEFETIDSQGVVGDTDFDGAPEILDAWGRPIFMLRSAPGFPSPLEAAGVENVWPLIYSGGPDRRYGLVTQPDVVLPRPIGSPLLKKDGTGTYLPDEPANWYEYYIDNIHNHHLLQEKRT